MACCDLTSSHHSSGTPVSNISSETMVLSIQCREMPEGDPGSHTGRTQGEAFGTDMCTLNM